MQEFPSHTCTCGVVGVAVELFVFYVASEFAPGEVDCYFVTLLRLEAITLCVANCVTVDMLNCSGAMFGVRRDVSLFCFVVKLRRMEDVDISFLYWFLSVL